MATKFLHYAFHYYKMFKLQSLVKGRFFIEGFKKINYVNNI